MWAALAVALVAGLGSGVALDRLLLDGPRRPEHRAREHRQRAERYLEELTRKLDLSPGQRSRVETILEANHEKAHAYWERAREDYRMLREEFRSEIRAALTAEQQQRFDELFPLRASGRRSDGRSR
jgi:Spy/CpxP family protein refolding chaperone